MSRTWPPFFGEDLKTNPDIQDAVTGIYLAVFGKSNCRLFSVEFAIFRKRGTFGVSQRMLPLRFRCLPAIRHLLLPSSWFSGSMLPHWPKWHSNWASLFQWSFLGDPWPNVSLHLGFMGLLTLIFSGLLIVTVPTNFTVIRRVNTLISRLSLLRLANRIFWISWKLIGQPLT